MPASSFSSSFPAAPTNGIPCWSSWKPGASPTNIRSAVGLPAPKTTCVRPCESRQRVHPETACSKEARAAGVVTPGSLGACSDAHPGSVAAAAGAPAAAAHPEARARLGAKRGEGRELPPHVLGPAIGAVRLLTVAHKLFEVGLAGHAHVLVDGHETIR